MYLANLIQMLVAVQHRIDYMFYLVISSLLVDYSIHTLNVKLVLSHSRCLIITHQTEQLTCCLYKNIKRI